MATASAAAALGALAIAGGTTYLLTDSKDFESIRLRPISEVREALSRQTWTSLGTRAEETVHYKNMAHTRKHRHELVTEVPVSEAQVATLLKPRRTRRRKALPFEKVYVNETLTPMGTGKKAAAPRKAAAAKRMRNDHHGGYLAPVPAADGVVLEQRSAIFRSTARKNAICVEHTEYLGDGNVTATNGSTVTASEYMINPLASETFAWLSGIAGNFEKYNFKWIRVDYIPRTGTTTEGSVLLAPEYDVNDPAASSASELFSMAGAKEGAPYKTFSVNLPHSSLHPKGPLYTRGYVAAGDNRLSDAAKLYVATVGQSNTDVIGRVAISYCCELIDPHEDTPSTQVLPAQTQSAYTIGLTPALTTTFTQQNINSENWPANYPNMGLSGSGTYVLPRGAWKVTMMCKYVSPGVAHIYGRIERYKGGAWSSATSAGVYVPQSGGYATTADAGSTATEGIVLIDDTSNSQGEIRCVCAANTSVTLTSLDINLLISPA